MKIKLVTSFDEAIWNKYGKKCIESWVANLNLGTDSVCEFWIKGPFPKNLPRQTNFGTPIKYKSVETQSEAWIYFYNSFGGHPKPGNLPAGTEYKFNFLPFSIKVYALAEASWPIKDGREDFDYLVWIDADVLMKSEVSADWLFSISKGADISWLDRAGQWNCGETGFMMVRSKVNENENHPLDIFLEQANTYGSGQLFYFGEWHDAFIFTSFVRLKEFTEKLRVQNLNKDMNGEVENGLYPFKTSVLNTKLVHYKGNLKDLV